MIIVFPFCGKDAPQMLDLLRWIKELGGAKKHDALVLSAQDAPWQHGREAIDLARASFRRVFVTTPDKIIDGWPLGCNLLFRTACEWIYESGAWPFFLWLEPDSIPLSAGWADAIEAEYRQQSRPFMACSYIGFVDGKAELHVSPIGIYPRDSWVLFRSVFDSPLAFDVSTRPIRINATTPTRLIQNFWGEKDLPPTFVNSFPPNTPPMNAFQMANVWPEAVIFHRNKDGTLIKMLRGNRKRGWLARPRRKEPATAPQVEVVYVFVANNQSYRNQALEFLASYRKNPPEVPHKTTIVCNNGTPDVGLRQMFDQLPGCQYLIHDNSGYDIGGFQHASRESTADLMLFLGATTYFTRPGWMKRVIASYLSHGEALYGTMGNCGDPGVNVNRHIRSTGFWLSRELFNQYPLKVAQLAQRYEFEHRANCLTEWVIWSGLKAWVVGWTGEYEWPTWTMIPNGYHRGDQSDLMIGDHLTRPPHYPRGVPVLPQARRPFQTVQNLNPITR